MIFTTHEEVQKIVDVTLCILGFTKTNIVKFKLSNVTFNPLIKLFLTRLEAHNLYYLFSIEICSSIIIEITGILDEQNIVNGMCSKICLEYLDEKNSRWAKPKELVHELLASQD